MIKSSKTDVFNKKTGVYFPQPVFRRFTLFYSLRFYLWLIMDDRSGRFASTVKLALFKSIH